MFANRQDSRFTSTFPDLAQTLLINPVSPQTHSHCGVLVNTAVRSCLVVKMQLNCVLSSEGYAVWEKPDSGLLSEVTIGIMKYCFLTQQIFIECLLEAVFGSANRHIL